MSLCMGHRSTYYTDEEEQAIEEIADEKDTSFSGVVRNAIQKHCEI